MRRHVLPLKKAKILTVWYSPFACIVSLTLILLKELSRVSAHVSHLHSLQCKTALVPRMVLLWLWLSEQQCKRSRDFLARWDLPDTTLTFYLAAWESNWYFATPHPAERRLRNKHRIPYWWRAATQNWVVLLIGWSHFPTNQVLGSDTSSLISMEFLRLFLRCYFAGKPVVASRTVGCFLELGFSHFPQKTNTSRFQHDLRGSGTTVL